MKDLISQVVSGDNGSCCPKLDLKTRVIGFVITFILGVVLLIMSFGAFFGVLTGNVGTFAFLYSAGNITAISS